MHSDIVSATMIAYVALAYSSSTPAVVKLLLSNTTFDFQSCLHQGGYVLHHANPSGWILTKPDGIQEPINFFLWSRIKGWIQEFN